MFKGTALLKLDQKKRITLPKKNCQNLDSLIEEEFFLLPNFEDPFYVCNCGPISFLEQKKPEIDTQNIDSYRRLALPKSLWFYLNEPTQLGFLGRGDYFTLTPISRYKNYLLQTTLQS